MNIAIVSYSYTENNNIFAECVSKNLSVKHIKIVVQKPVTIKSITLDMIFARTPKVHPDPDILKQYDLILFFGPVWLGQVAFPLRAYLNYLRTNPKQYCFFSISGGSDLENPKLSSELLRRTGIKPAILLDQHIKNLLPLNQSTTRKDTSAYKISESDANQISEKAIQEIKKLFM